MTDLKYNKLLFIDKFYLFNLSFYNEYYLFFLDNFIQTLKIHFKKVESEFY